MNTPPGLWVAIVTVQGRRHHNEAGGHIRRSVGCKYLLYRGCHRRSTPPEHGGTARFDVVRRIGVVVIAVNQVVAAVTPAVAVVYGGGIAIITIFGKCRQLPLMSRTSTVQGSLSSQSITTIYPDVKALPQMSSTSIVQGRCHCKLLSAAWLKALQLSPASTR